MDLQKKLLKLIPSALKKRIKQISFFYLLTWNFDYDKKRYFKYSATLNSNTELKLLGRILVTTHVLEKGLTMPKVRYGFGKECVSELIKYCNIYKNSKFDICSTTYMHAISVIKEYLLFHKNRSYSLDLDLSKKIQDFIAQNGSFVQVEPQIEFNGNSYFCYVNSSFPEFSNSRHSVRNLSEGIDDTCILSAIKLAANTPTACNRQPQRIHVVGDKSLIAKIMQLQSGNRGFGHLADKLLIITVDISAYCGSAERNYPFVDGGLYAMNLLYALHYYRIGACTLNWCYTPEKDKELRKLIRIGDSETVVLFIMCGKVPEKLIQLTCSKRNDPIIFYDE